MLGRRFMTTLSTYQRCIAASRYAQYKPQDKTRETFPEIAARTINFFRERTANVGIPWDELQQAIIRQDIVPSARCFASAGPALAEHNAAAYNCSYTPFDSPEVPGEILYLLQCGTGVGFSVEKKYVAQLPSIPGLLVEGGTPIVVEDSREGWAKGYNTLIKQLYQGYIPSWNLQAVRPKGAPLKSSGGRASGPEVLDELMKYTVNLFKQAKGRQLTCLECHDLACRISEIVIVNGVRRSALISLSDLDNQEMATAKSGEWWKTNVQRSLANNSAVHTLDVTEEQFSKELDIIYASRSGERGIFNRQAYTEWLKAQGHRREIFDEFGELVEFGTNPCGEVLLPKRSFCNLTEIIARYHDDMNSLIKKIELATILGTVQSTLIDFKFLRPSWRETYKRERLLGVSVTGIYDNKHLSTVSASLAKDLQLLKQVAIDTNRIWADKLGIERSAAITCCKPSGTISQLVNSSSGIHPRFAPYFVRNVRFNDLCPILKFLLKNGYKAVRDPYANNNWVVGFPMAAPEGCITAQELKASEHVELINAWKDNYCEHNVSATVMYTEEEWSELKAALTRYRHNLTGITVLPRDGGTYQLAPYQKIDKETYEKMILEEPKNLDWSTYREERDVMTDRREFACSGNKCEL